MFNKTKAKILFLDIETAPAQVYTWQLYDLRVGIDQIIEDQFMMSWAAKWHGDNKIYFDSIQKHRKEFKKNPRSEAAIIKKIWELMDEADIIVGHHGESFDFPWLNTVFLRHGYPPVSSYKTVDTRREAKNCFKFISNKLDFLCKRLHLGTKIHHDGFDLWKRCMQGDKRSWKLMEKYNKEDVRLLEKLYDKIRPYMKRHPNMSLYDDSGKRTCPKCGNHRLKSKGLYRTNASSYRRLICIDCGASSREATKIKREQEDLRNV